MPRCRWVSSFELDGYEHAKRRVPALTIVEDLEVLEDRRGQPTRVFHRLRSSSSTCIRDQNDTITAVVTAPTDPIDGSIHGGPIPPRTETDGRFELLAPRAISSSKSARQRSKYSTSGNRRRVVAVADKPTSSAARTPVVRRRSPNHIMARGRSSTPGPHLP